MPDITMCNGYDCPLKKKCYRCTATPSKLRQSYFSTTPYDHTNTGCDYYWDNSGYRSKTKKSDDNK